jgi:hypothetical protein
MLEHRMDWRDFALALVVLALAAGLRCWYASACLADLHQPPPFQVQDGETAVSLLPPPSAEGHPRNQHQSLVDNLVEYNWFGGLAPLAGTEEATAHLSPGYPLLIATAKRWLGDGETATYAVVWLQVALGSLASLLYFLFARIKFGSTSVGLLAGLLTAVHPFWIVNVAEIQDGTLASFLLALTLLLGTVSAKRGSPLGSLLFGVVLAGTVMVRASWMPYAFVACMWFLVCCRTVPRGWLCATLVFLGFGNGLVPWMARDLQAFGEVAPIVDSAYLHLWIGANSHATGGPQDEETLRKSLAPARLETLLAEENQARRYQLLAGDVRESVESSPGKAGANRLRAAICFALGSAWVEHSALARTTQRSDFPPWLTSAIQRGLPIMLLGMLVLSLLGWRWSFGWRREASLASLALLWVPIPAILSHADRYSGARLPLDGVLLCFAAFALMWMLPPVARIVFTEHDEE